MKRISLLTLLFLGLANFLPCTAHAQVVISEFMADNKNTLADEDGAFPDWIELYNSGSTPVNLSGWTLTDDITGTTKWVFPATNISAKGFLVVFASGKDRRVPGARLHTSFNIRAAGEYLALSKPDGTAATEFAPSAPQQYTGFSYGTSLDVATNALLRVGAPLKWRVPTDGSLGTGWRQKTYDDSAWSPGRSGVGYQTAVPGFAVYNYAANIPVCSIEAAYDVINNPAQQRTVYAENTPVINFLNTSSSARFGSDLPFPGMPIGADQDNFATYATAIITIPSAGEWTFGVNSDDGFTLTIGGNYMEFPWPRGPADTLSTFYFDQPGDYELQFVFYECGGGAEVELFAASGARPVFDPSVFKLVGATGGLAVRSMPVSGGSSSGGYRTHIATDLRDSMETVNGTVYLRIPFNVTNAPALQSLTLRMMYDDGFIAYLNGQEVARRNAPANASWNSTATAAHPNSQAVLFEEINVSDFLGSLQTGTNVLAIQALNQSASDSDFLLVPELVEYVPLGSSLKYFATPTPGSLNGAGYAAFVQDTKFSIDRGFFETPFSLSITTATTGATIIYTTNGSIPALTNGTVYTGPLTISKTTVLRAAAFKDGFVPSNPDTQTYLFLQDVVRQSPYGEPPPGWPASWGSISPNYGMDPDIVNSGTYSSQMIPSLKSLPSFSIVTDLKNLFDGSVGIYANPGQDGVEWERPISFELIQPDGTDGFQVEAGLRIRGGYSRSTWNPKHGFRLLFRSRYGDAQLNYPLFAKQGGAESYDSFDLRTFQNYSWSFEGDYRFIGLRDQWNRDTQLAMGHQGERGDFFHLYINGHYWGIYNSAERPEASYSATYFGGNEEDYDVVKVEAGIYSIYATDGDLNAWHRLWRAATNGFGANSSYYAIQGRNANGSPNPNLENLLDVDNLIDYMLLNFYVGNIDAPISDFLGNDRPNNYYAVRNRTGKFGGFRFFSHDGEHTLHHESTRSNQELTRDRTGPFGAGDPVRQGASAFSYSNPQYLFTRLTDNAEFRSLLADRIHKHFFNRGALTAEANRARFLSRSNEIYSAIVAESARWGDSKVEPPRTRDNEWLTEVRRVHDSYMGQRTAIVLNQLRTKGWYPAVAAPTFSQHAGNVPPGFSLGMTVPQGTIYYTTDGSDPRAAGAPSANAKTYSGPIRLNSSATIKARAQTTSGWSALNEATFYVVQSYSGLLITEFMYNPLGSVTNDGDNYEFIELKNVNSTNIELSGLRFTNGINYVFPPGVTLAPGAFHLLVSDPGSFTNRYSGARIGGSYTNRLSNSGEALTLVHADGKPIFSVNYGTRLPWPPLADGEGFSLVSAHPNINPDPNDSRNWRASTLLGGSPGTDDPAPTVAPVYINEVLSRSTPPEQDWVEIYNPHSTNVSIAGWFLTDDRNEPRKFKLPSTAIIPAGGYYVVNEADWNAQPSPSGPFALSSLGDEVYLYSADATGNLTGYSHGFGFGAAREGVTFGRLVNSAKVENFPAQSAPTRGAANSGPRREALVITEINYNPGPGSDEFLELKSITNGVLRLFDPQFPTNTWRVSGISFSFPENVSIAPSSIVLLVKTNAAAFRTKYQVGASVPIYTYSGALQGGGETLSVQFPDAPVADSGDSTIRTPYIDADVVRYDDDPPWPALADGLGASLERINPSGYGDDPANWRASPEAPTPGVDGSANREPTVNAGVDVAVEATSFPAQVTLTGSVTDDGQPGPGTLTHTWQVVSGPAGAWFQDPATLNTKAFFNSRGSYVLRLTGSDGELQKTDEVTVTISRPITLAPTTLVATNAIWKFLDNGSDQGTGWKAIAYNDAAWQSGRAPLGYGDANGSFPATTNSFGPSITNKFLTTYYRHSFVLSDATSYTNLLLSVQRDDGVMVFLNGQPVLTNNLPAEGVTYQTPAASVVSGADELAIVQLPLPQGLLKNGTNTFAAEVHQSGGDSTDLFFNLSLSGQSGPLNAAPLVNAGADRTLAQPGSISLSALVTDDGLPVAGLLQLAWSKMSGPGNVAFSAPNLPNTAASFSDNGQYVLRLTATDGTATVTDELTVQVGNPATPSPRITSVQSVSQPSPALVLKFEAAANTSYTVQFSGNLLPESWKKLEDVPAMAQSRTVTITDPAVPSSAKFYRVVSPSQ